MPDKDLSEVLETLVRDYGKVKLQRLAKGRVQVILYFHDYTPHLGKQGDTAEEALRGLYEAVADSS